MWFMAMWYVTNQKNGVSALGLQRVLGLGSYETAWTWLHKLRRAMVRPGRDSLCGTVEVDETYVGGVEKGRRGRQTETKAIVAVAAEENGKGIGRIRLRRVTDVSGASLLPFVQSAVVPGAVVHTDGWSGYCGLMAAGYKHEATVVSASPDPAHVVMPRVHNIAALLKRWLLGTHQGGIQHVSTTTLTSSPSGSTAAGPKQGACFSTGSFSRPSPSDRPRTTPLSTTLIPPSRPLDWSERDTPFAEYFRGQPV
jgi:transposase-like protein